MTTSDQFSFSSSSFSGFHHRVPQIALWQHNQSQCDIHSDHIGLHRRRHGGSHGWWRGGGQDGEEEGLDYQPGGDGFGDGGGDHPLGGDQDDDQDNHDHQPGSRPPRRHSDGRVRTPHLLGSSPSWQTCGWAHGRAQHGAFSLFYSLKTC